MAVSACPPFLCRRLFHAPELPSLAPYPSSDCAELSQQAFVG